MSFQVTLSCALPKWCLHYQARLFFQIANIRNTLGVFFFFYLELHPSILWRVSVWCRSDVFTFRTRLSFFVLFLSPSFTVHREPNPKSAKAHLFYQPFVLRLSKLFVLWVRPSSQPSAEGVVFRLPPGTVSVCWSVGGACIAHPASDVHVRGIFIFQLFCLFLFAVFGAAYLKPPLQTITAPHFLGFCDYFFTKTQKPESFWVHLSLCGILGCTMHHKGEPLEKNFFFVQNADFFVLFFAIKPGSGG